MLKFLSYLYFLPFFQQALYVYEIYNLKENLNTWLKKPPIDDTFVFCLFILIFKDCFLPGLSTIDV